METTWVITSRCLQLPVIHRCCVKYLHCIFVYSTEKYFSYVICIVFNNDVIHYSTHDIKQQLTVVIIHIMDTAGQDTESWVFGSCLLIRRCSFNPRHRRNTIILRWLFIIYYINTTTMIKWLDSKNDFKPS